MYTKPEDEQRRKETKIQNCVGHFVVIAAGAQLYEYYFPADVFPDKKASLPPA